MPRLTDFGKFDRRIRLETEVITQNSTGEGERSFILFKEIWAGTTPMSATERFRAAEIHASRVTRFVIRWMAGVLTTMRIYFDGNYYRITGIREIGRRDFLEISAEALDGNFQ